MGKTRIPDKDRRAVEGVPEEVALRETHQPMHPWTSVSNSDLSS